MIAYELTAKNAYAIWVTNEHGKEPLGKLKRDGQGEWYYEPLAGSYLYVGALLHIVLKLDELNSAAEETAGAPKSVGGQFEVI